MWFWDKALEHPWVGYPPPLLERLRITLLLMKIAADLKNFGNQK